MKVFSDKLKNVDKLMCDSLRHTGILEHLIESADKNSPLTRTMTKAAKNNKEAMTQLAEWSSWETVGLVKRSLKTKI